MPWLGQYNRPSKPRWPPIQLSPEHKQNQNHKDPVKMKAKLSAENGIAKRKRSSSSSKGNTSNRSMPTLLPASSSSPNHAVTCITLVSGSSNPSPIFTTNVRSAIPGLSINNSANTSPPFMANTASSNSPAFSTSLLANIPNYLGSNGVNYNTSPHGNPRLVGNSTQIPRQIPTLGPPREEESDGESKDDQMNDVHWNVDGGYESAESSSDSESEDPQEQGRLVEDALTILLEEHEEEDEDEIWSRRIVTWINEATGAWERHVDEVAACVSSMNREATRADYCREAAARLECSRSAFTTHSCSEHGK